MSPAVSPEGDRAVLARTEHGSSGQLPLVDWLAVPVAVDWVPSVAVGEPTATTTISLVDLASGAETPVTLDDSALQVWQVVAWVDGDPLLLAMRRLGFLAKARSPIRPLTTREIALMRAW